MTTTLTTQQQATVDTLRNQLDDPQVAAALSTLLDHADLLAVLLVGLDGFVSRSETIGAALVEGIEELRGVAASPSAEGLAPAELAASAGALAAAVARITPALTRAVDAGVLDAVLNSAITSPEVIGQISRLGRALAAGSEQAASSPLRVPGAFGLLKLIKDPDINRGIGYLLSVIKALGAELRTPEHAAH